MSALIPTALDLDPLDAERVAHERFAREHSARAYRTMLTDLYREWHGYNAAHFAGRLGVPHIAIGRTSPRRFSMCRRTTNYGGAMCITLNEGILFATNTRVVRYTGGGYLRYVMDMLLAETVCQAVREIEDDDEVGYEGFGPRFVAHANRIGRELGLDPVVARRRGAPDRSVVPAANWPWGVRPAGYYAPDIVLTSEQRWRRPLPTPSHQAGLYQYFLFLLRTEPGTDRLRQILGRHVDAATVQASPAVAAAERGPKPRPAVDVRWVEWNDGCVRLMAAFISRLRAFDVMPILADALEEAGCDVVPMLDHCRQTQTHTADCWVLKAIRDAGRT